LQRHIPYTSTEPGCFIEGKFPLFLPVTASGDILSANDVFTGGLGFFVMTPIILCLVCPVKQKAIATKKRTIPKNACYPQGRV